MAYYRKIQELADEIARSNSSLNQEQLCRKVHNQIGENSYTIADILLFMKKYDSFCKKGEQLNKKVVDYLILRRIAPHSIREVTACIAMGTASVKDKRDLIDKKLSLRHFLRNSRVDEISENITDVCRDIKNLYSHYIPTEEDTVKIFLVEVDRLERTLDMLFSESECYNKTFEEMSNDSKQKIKDGCERLERISKVMQSVI